MTIIAKWDEPCHPALKPQLVWHDKGLHLNTEEWGFTTPDGKTHFAKKNLITDLASIPKWTLIFYVWLKDVASAAFAVHDQLYAIDSGVSRKYADWVMKVILEWEGVPSHQIYIIYYICRVTGWAKFQKKEAVYLA